MSLKVIAIAAPGPSTDAVVAQINRLGAVSAALPPGPTAFAAAAAQAPDVVVVTADGGAASTAAAISGLKALLPELECIVLAAPDRAQALEADLGAECCGVASTPPDARELALLLRIADERIHARKRQHREKRRIARRAKHRFDRRMETERFLTVKQVVDKVSTFIGDMAREVEGGVRYFNEIPYFIAIHDRNYRITAANRAYRVLLGRKQGDLSWAVYDGGAAERNTCPVGRTFETESAMELRETLCYRSGAKVPVIVHTAPIYNNSGRVEMVLEVSAGTRDIHQLRRDLHSTQQRYQQLFDAVPCCVAVLDRDMRFTATNHHFNDIFGNRTGAAFTECFTIGNKNTAATPLFKTYSDGAGHHGEMTLITDDWRRVPVLAWTSPITSAAGKLLQVLLIFMDITQIRDLQNNLTFLGLMIASISHSIKGVLAGLDAGVYTLDRAVKTGDQAQIREGLELVAHMSERIQKITLDILFYAKERELNRAPVDLPSFVDDLVAAVLPRFQRRDIVLVTDRSGADGTFEPDAGLLRAALVNVLENALDACVANQQHHRTHRVMLTVQSTRDAVGFSVEDNGMGMTSEQLKKLFKVFYSTKGIQGTGLGLFIADSIIRQHGGDIAVESNLGQGARFCIQIPRTPQR